jgi:hypothetical protein
MYKAGAIPEILDFLRSPSIEMQKIGTNFNRSIVFCLSSLLKGFVNCCLGVGWLWGFLEYGKSYT